MGAIDGAYIQKANDVGAILGRRIALSQPEVEASNGIVDAMGRQTCPN
jgi:hypothetical protein